MSDFEKRINDLESKFSFQEELVNELNLIVAEQQGEIKILTEAIKYLKDSAGQDGQSSNMNNERPPHY